MKRLTPIIITVAVAGVCCVVAAFFSFYYYNLHLHTALQVRGEMEWKVDDLGARLAKLEADKPRHLIPFHARGRISTTNIPRSDSVTNLSPVSVNYELRVVTGKMNSIVPEIRIPKGSTAVHKFKVAVGPEKGSVVSAWTSLEEPFGNMTDFEQFHIFRNETNALELVIQLRPDVSVDMGFGIVVLRESLWPTPR